MGSPLHRVGEGFPLSYHREDRDISLASWSVKRTNHTAIRYRAVLSLRSILIFDCPSGSSSKARSALCCHDAGSVMSSFSLQRAHAACDPLSAGSISPPYVSSCGWSGAESAR